MSGDQWLMAIIAFGVWFLTSVFWVVYGTYKADQMRQRHQAEQDVLRHENTEMARMVRRTEIQARTFGQLPVSRLVGDQE